MASRNRVGVITSKFGERPESSVGANEMPPGPAASADPVTWYAEPTTTPGLRTVTPRLSPSMGCHCSPALTSRLTLCDEVRLAVPKTESVPLPESMPPKNWLVSAKLR